MKADLAELERRLSEATKGDSDLDWLITQWADPDAIPFSSAHLHYSTSVDAAFALVERKASDLVLCMTRLGDGSGRIQIIEAWLSESGVEVVDSSRPMDPAPGGIAVCRALIKALGASHAEP